MKKIFSLSLALVLTTIFFVGCTPGEEETVLQETEVEGMVVNLSNITSTSAYLITKSTDRTSHRY